MCRGNYNSDTATLLSMIIDFNHPPCIQPFKQIWYVVTFFGYLQLAGGPHFSVPVKSYVCLQLQSNFELGKVWELAVKCTKKQVLFKVLSHNSWIPKIFVPPDQILHGIHYPPWNMGSLPSWQSLCFSLGCKMARWSAACRSIAQDESRWWEQCATFWIDEILELPVNYVIRSSHLLGLSNEKESSWEKELQRL